MGGNGQGVSGLQDARIERASILSYFLILLFLENLASPSIQFLSCSASSLPRLLTRLNLTPARTSQCSVQTESEADRTNSFDKIDVRMHKRRGEKIIACFVVYIFVC